VTEQAPDLKAGDFVRLDGDHRLWLVDEVDGDCAWISDKHGEEEWVPLSRLEKVER
jgi:hypothetical protein